MVLDTGNIYFFKAVLVLESRSIITGFICSSSVAEGVLACQHSRWSFSSKILQ